MIALKIMYFDSILLECVHDPIYIRHPEQALANSPVPKESIPPLEEPEDTPCDESTVCFKLLKLITEHLMCDFTKIAFQFSITQDISVP